LAHALQSLDIVAKPERTWIVRKPDDRMFSCPDQSTLQRWIVEGRVLREDKISGDGATWRRLGDSRILAPFFDAYDRAILADEIDRRAGKQHPPKPHPPRHARVDTDEWMRRGDRPKKRMNPHAFDELGMSDSDDDPEADRIVRNFHAKRLARTALLWVLGASLLVFAIAYVVALQGPENNPVRRYVKSRGLLPGRESREKAAAEYRALARKEYDKGDIATLDRAIEHLDHARALVKEDLGIAADLGLVLLAKADVLEQWGRDLIQEADAKAASGDGAAAAKLRGEASQRRADARPILDRAKSVLAEAQQGAPNALETQRALADLYRLSGDDAREREWLERAHVTEAASHLDDAWTVLVDAKILEGDVERSSAETLAQVSELLENALRLNPELLRARIDLARIHLARGAVDRAESEIERVLAKSPAHLEAQRLMRRLTSLKVRNAKEHEASNTQS
jgi:tetratricopeptide repeat protein